MKARRVGPVVACLLLHVAWAYAGANDEADGVVRANQHDVIQVTGGLLTVSVDRSPLFIVLDVIARQSGVSIRCDAPIAETVTANLRDIALDEGLTRIVGARSAVFVYSDNAAAGHRPRLVEVRVYADQAPPPGSPAAASADQQWRVESAEDVASTGGASGTFARSSSSTEDQSDTGRSAPALRQLTRALSEEHEPSARARAAIALGRIGGAEAIAHLAAAIATDPATAVRGSGLLRSRGRGPRARRALERNRRGGARASPFGGSETLRPRGGRRSARQDWRPRDLGGSRRSTRRRAFHGPGECGGCARRDRAP